MRIGIIGGGPGGSLCAALLGQAGAEVLLFDYRGVWEKPCGSSKFVSPRPMTPK
jgi:flavin-dependent dehydrogenase